MILVTLGTQDKPFPRLIEAVERQVELGNIKDEVIVQAGCTEYKSDKIKIIDYMDETEFKKLFKEADIVITHAGVGNIIYGLEQHKKMIVAARLEKYGEHVNDHQLQILDNFADEGYIIPLYTFDKLNEAIEKTKTFTPKEYVHNNDYFIENLEILIENML